jgi:hypothetical protein
MSQQDPDTRVFKVIRELRALQDKASPETAEFLRSLLQETYRKHADTGASTWGVRGRDGVARMRTGVVVDTKDLVMKVFLDSERNYSVSGYNARARKCFGEIYLGLDKGPEYDRQATRVNEAIQSITAEDAFGLALQETRKALAAHPGTDDVSLTVVVLAALCRRWFDLPDEVNVVEGGLDFDAEPPAHCPGDFTLPSAYMFKPDPDEFLLTAGPAVGNLLKAAVTAYVAQMRASQKQPTGVVSRAIFEAFPSGEDDLIARTLIGVMMGMLPTVTGNLEFVMTTWRGDGRFTALQEVLRLHAGTDRYARAIAVLKQPLMQTMQTHPVPDAVWRTAVREHTLGTTHPVKVSPGDKVYVNIVGATREDLDAGVTDVFAVFGGDRRGMPHPTHACPGYKAAIGTMLGIINGSMEPT